MLQAYIQRVHLEKQSSFLFGNFAFVYFSIIRIFVVIDNSGEFGESSREKFCFVSFSHWAAKSSCKIAKSVKICGEIKVFQRHEVSQKINDSYKAVEHHHHQSPQEEQKNSGRKQKSSKCNRRIKKKQNTGCLRKIYNTTQKKRSDLQWR
ncbi:uncharacterized protein LOC128862346 isoform X2 [Anastrepha ludens]|uniref:uncharacterized protein LOC128862346 isoform X2 n=1 Tax=Anastrepha ludens TaxID=28586 RepID=UPI0023B0E964|nr:uncharacterized protein LOC128862346 isoform X2 [Anastrepha ludens]